MAVHKAVYIFVAVFAFLLVGAYEYNQTQAPEEPPFVDRQQTEQLTADHSSKEPANIPPSQAQTPQLPPLYQTPNGQTTKRNHSDERIAIVMLVTDTTRNTVPIQVSIAEKQEYADKHGYDLYVTPRVDQYRDTAWSKLIVMERLMNHNDNNPNKTVYTWIWSLDVDTVITNDNFQLETLLPPRPTIPGDIERANVGSDKGPHLLIGKDCNGINAGSFLIRSDEWSRNFLLKMLNQTPRSHPWSVFLEQGSLMYFQATDIEVAKRVWIVPIHWLNAYPPTLSCKGGSGFPWKGWEPNSFLVHFPGMPNKPALLRSYRELRKSGPTTVNRKEVEDWFAVCRSIFF